ncbi:MAG: M4 family metallopeptidase, partial [Bacteroidaceae bacterium]|nr:M4 family metallopeptidase [Bacteroidaceae bacterium]
NDKGYSYDITGIGIEKSRQIAYRTLTEYATQESQYADIRLASLQAATDLFGADAVEVATVDEAWKAVGVVDGGDATAIRNTRLATDGLLSSDNAIYDLSGRKVQNPQKGLYVKSGKKVLVSDKR